MQDIKERLKKLEELTQDHELAINLLEKKLHDLRSELSIMLYRKGSRYEAKEDML